MIENKQLEKNLQFVRQEVEQLRATTHNVVSTMGEMRTMILVEVSTLGETMWKFYDGFVTMHKVVVRFHGLQQHSKEFFKTLKNIHASITYV